VWTHDDRAKALAYLADQNAHHASCGQRMSDWQDDKGVELRNPPFESNGARSPERGRTIRTGSTPAFVTSPMRVRRSQEKRASTSVSEREP
jgi:hypothetical protein